MLVQYDEKFDEKLEIVARELREKYTLDEKQSLNIARTILLYQQANKAYKLAKW